MKFIKAICIGLVIFCIPFTAKPWGQIGHRIVGEIASKHVNKKSKKEIEKILGNESIAFSSTWADFIKSDSNFDYLYNWHFINLPARLLESEFHQRLAADTSVNAYTKINFLANELKNNLATLSNSTKQMYLRVLVHLVGDVHQPLHVGRLEDKGGNTIKVKWFSDFTNLHRVWDESLIDFQQLSYTEYATALNYVTASQKQQWQSQPVAAWLWDSYTKANKIYSDIQPDQRLDYLYNFKFVGMLNEQLLKAGVHLAGLLDYIFK